MNCTDEAGNKMSLDSFLRLEHPQRTVTKLEILASLVVALQLVQLTFGALRRRSGNPALQYGVWGAYTASYSLAIYALGTMQSTPIRGEMYPALAIALFLALGCSTSITAYGFDDNRGYWKLFFDVALSSYYLEYIMTGSVTTARPPLLSNNNGEFLPPVYTKVDITYDALPSSHSHLRVLVMLVFAVAVYLRFLAFWIACNGSNSDRFFADFIKYKVELNGHGPDQYDATGMTDYTYLVSISGQKFKFIPSRCRHEPERPDGLVTVEKICSSPARLLQTSSPADTGTARSKDTCLSFALFHLLKRRFQGASCPESRLQKTRDLFLVGLLPDCERAFRVIELELSFLYDHFFTGYAVAYERPLLVISLCILKIALISAVLVSTLNKSKWEATRRLADNDKHTKIAFLSSKADTILVLAILALLDAMELLQIGMYMASNWAVVYAICRYVRHASSRTNTFFLQTIGLLNRRAHRSGQWKNKIGQCSLLKKYIWCQSLSMVDLPVAVKRAIACSLVESSGHLANGEKSLRKNGMEHVSWACDQETEVHVILLWHIATSYCELIPPEKEHHDGSEDSEREKEHHDGSEDSEREKEHREVATKLSKYCTYLVRFLPRLITNHIKDAHHIAKGVMEESTEFLGKARSSREKYEVMKSLAADPDDQAEEPEGFRSIFKMGAKLGRQLEVIPSGERRWKVMADFWAETVLYVAPSNDVTAHGECLAKGGEFLTHVWALLSNAGILDQPNWPIPPGAEP